MASGVEVPRYVDKWVYYEPGRLHENLYRIRTTYTPPEPGHVTVRVRAASVNPVDMQLAFLPHIVYAVKGTANQCKTPGMDFAGHVIEVGAGVTSFKPGDPVFGMVEYTPNNGTLSQVVHVSADKGALSLMPATLSFQEAAAIPLVYMTGLTVLKGTAALTSSSDGKSVLIVGASGGSGIAMLQLAKAMHKRVTAVCSGRNADMVKELGADHVIDYTQESVSASSPGAPFDVIVDCVGGPPSEKGYPEAMAANGHYVTIVGDKTGIDTIGGPITYLTHPRMILRYLLGLLGLNKRYDCVILSPSRQMMESVLMYLPASIRPVLDSTFPFAEARQAYARLHSKRAQGKVIVDV